jgi:hypothetical protein
MTTPQSDIKPARRAKGSETRRDNVYSRSTFQRESTLQLYQYQRARFHPGFRKMRDIYSVLCSIAFTEIYMNVFHPPG